MYAVIKLYTFVYVYLLSKKSGNIPLKCPFKHKKKRVGNISEEHFNYIVSNRKLIIQLAKCQRVITDRLI